jgi:uncharacterized protein
MIQLLQEIILDFQHHSLFTGIKRELKYEFLEKKAFVCIGVRRAGKTTFLYQIIGDLLKKDVKKENILYINFFDDRLMELKSGNLNLILEAYYSLYPFKKNSEKVYFFFDELQEITNWEPFINRLLRTENCEVFITGSSAKMLSKEIATQMRGRAITFELFPFSFTEFLKYKEINYLSLTSKNRHLIQNAFNEYFQKGGFPEVRKSSRRTRIQIHQEYYKSILLRDVVERYDALHPQAVMHAGYRLISSVSSLYSINRLTSYLKSLGFKISKDFVTSCTHWFEDVFFLFSMKIFHFSVSKQNVNAKKIYCIDHSLAASVSPQFTENKGLLLENLIFTHIRRQTNNTFYYRTRKGLEVDFLFFDEAKNPHLLQVCYSLEDIHTKHREVKALTEAMRELSLKSATIVTMNMESELQTEKGHIKILPAWKFLIDYGKFTTIN